MKKSILLLVTTILFMASSSMVNGQKIKNDEVKILKGKRAVITAEFDIPAKIMEKVVLDHLSDEGLRRPSKKSGFYIYEKVTFGKISSDILDYYVKIEGKKNKSTVIFAVSKGYDNFISQSEGGIYSKFGSVFKSIDEKAQKAFIDEQLKEQQKVVDKTKKRYDRLVSEGKSLQKDKENIENKIKKNAKDQEGMKKQLEEEQSKLKSIK
jgi:hypothetical protein